MEVNFTQVGTYCGQGDNGYVPPTSGNYGRTFENIQYYNYQLFESYNHNLPNPSQRTVLQLILVDFIFTPDTT